MINEQEEQPAGWCVAQIEDVGKVSLGRQRSPANHVGPNMRSYVRAANITWNGWNFSDVKQMNFNKEDFARYQLHPGDVLINEGSGSANEVGKPAIWRGEIADCCFQNTLLRIEPEACTSEFLFQYIRWNALSGKFVTSTKGVNIYHIGREGLAKHEIAVPPLREQRRVIAKIDSLSAKSARARDHLDHIPRLVEKYKQAVLSAAFRGDITSQWRKANTLPDPKTAVLQELLAEPIRNGLSVRGSDTPPGIRALRLSALRGGTVDLRDVRYLPLDKERALRFLIKDEDVLVSRGNGTRAFVGIASLVENVEEPTIFPDTAFRLRFKQDIAHPLWIVRIWNSEAVRLQIERAAKTTAGIWKIAQGDLNQIELVLPCPAEQNEVVRILQATFGWIDRLAAEATSARKLIEHLDQAVLAKAFRGELVPQDPNDEPASLLLERIRAGRAAAPVVKRGRRNAST